MVSAWASDIRLVLGQLKTDDKSNEITAIPELIKTLAMAINLLKREKSLKGGRPHQTPQSRMGPRLSA